MAAKSDFARRTHIRRSPWCHLAHLLFYHDPLSLSLMMAKFIDWMNTQFHNGMSYCNRLVKPESRRNAGTVFRGRIVGNSPELMCWDFFCR